MSVAENHQHLMEALSAIPDRQERLAAIVERARRRAPLPLQNKSAAERVPGCVSPVWITGELLDGRLHFRGEAEAPVVNGLVRLMCELYDDTSPDDAISSEPRIFEDLDLIRDLTPTRRNGLAAVRRRIHDIAVQHRDAGVRNADSPDT